MATCSLKNKYLTMKLAITLYYAVFNVPVAAVVSFCYYKHQDKVNMLQNQSCITRQVHLVENLISTDYNSTEAERTPSGPSGTAFSQLESPVEMCVIFRYVVKQNLSSLVTAQSSISTFACDFSNWCLGQTGLHFNVTVEGYAGDLFCCDSNNCNAADKMPPLSPPQVCYSNVHNWGHSGLPATGTYVLCHYPDSWCIRTRQLNATPFTSAFDCDNQRRCQDFNMTSGSSLVCRNVSQESQVVAQEELCCCSGENCFAASWQWSTTSVSGLQGGALSAATLACILAFTLLALLGGAAMIGLMYQRRSLPNTSNLTHTYSRIEDEDNSDSIQML